MTMNPYDDRTHDVSLVDYHVKDIETFGATLDKVAAAAFPRDGRTRYSKVYVLLLSWEADNLGVISEIRDLQHVFSETYRYETEHWQIPSKSAFNALRKKLNGVLNDYDHETNLLIVYYGGHGFMDIERRCMWSCTGAEDSATLPWYGLQTSLEQADSDVLILLDCCAAASCTGGSGNGVTEVIAACGFETWAPGVGEHSFTRSLISVLEDWEDGHPPLSGAVLHSEILSRIKYWNPKYHNISQHQRREGVERRKTPIHITVSNQDNKRSIVLSPIKLPPKPSSEPSSSPVSPHRLTPEAALPSSPLSDHDTFKEVCGGPEDHCPTVLITLALEDDQRLETSGWARWLHSAPGLIKHGHVQGIYKSDSILVLLTLPVAIWDLLPNHPAVKFISFVRSRELMKGKLEHDYDTLKQFARPQLFDYMGEQFNDPWSSANLRDDSTTGSANLRYGGTLGSSANLRDDSTTGSANLRYGGTPGASANLRDDSTTGSANLRYGGTLANLGDNSTTGSANLRYGGTLGSYGHPFDTLRWSKPGTSRPAWTATESDC